jgi:hypothetical protein
LEQKSDEPGLCLKNGYGLLHGKNAATSGTNHQMEAVLFLAGSEKPEPGELIASLCLDRESERWDICLRFSNLRFSIRLLLVDFWSVIFNRIVSWRRDFSSCFSRESYFTFLWK